MRIRLQNIQHERVAKSVNLRRERLLRRERVGQFVKNSLDCRGEGTGGQQKVREAECRFW